MSTIDENGDPLFTEEEMTQATATSLALRLLHPARTAGKGELTVDFLTSSVMVAIGVHIKNRPTLQLKMLEDLRDLLDAEALV